MTSLTSFSRGSGPQSNAPGYKPDLVVPPFYWKQQFGPFDELSVQPGAALGIGSDIYLGFSPTQFAQSTFYTNLIKWDGSSWSSIPFTGGGPIMCMAKQGTDLIVGGYWPGVGAASGTASIARWNGTSWSSIGGGINGFVTAIAADDSQIVAAGQITQAGDSTVHNIAIYKNGKWSGMGAGLNPYSGEQIHALAIFGDYIYAGGFFDLSPSPPVGLMRWDGHNWNSINAVLGPVFALGVKDDSLYLGGQFNIVIGPKNLLNAAKWDGTNFTTVGNLNFATSFGTVVELPGPVTAISVVGSTIYYGGAFTTYIDNTGTHTAGGVVSYDGTNWHPYHAGLDVTFSPGFNTIRGIGVAGKEVVVTGLFGHASNIPTSVEFLSNGVTRYLDPNASTNLVARWTGSAWSPIESGLDQKVNVLLSSKGSVYAGGGFSFANGQLLRGVARWDHKTWNVVDDTTNLGTAGLPGPNTVTGMAMDSSDNLYICGSLTGKSPVARWNGSVWTDLLCPSTVKHLAWGTDNKLYATTDTSVLVWNGSTWTQAGGGVNGLMNAITVYDSGIVIGGSFTSVGGITANKVAFWNGTVWSALSADAIQDVYSLLEGPNGLVIGCGTGGLGNGLLLWDGTAYQAFDNWPGDFALSLAYNDSVLLAGCASGKIFQQDGSNWIQLGDVNANNQILTLAVSGGDVFAGGDFTWFGRQSGHIACWSKGVRWSGVFNNSAVNKNDALGFPIANGIKKISHNSVNDVAEKTLSHGVTTDNEHNTYIAGYTDTKKTKSDYLIRKLSPHGALLWSVILDGGFKKADMAYAVQVDSKENIYVTGESDGGATSFDMYTVKLDKNGHTLWTSRHSTPSTKKRDAAYSIGLSPDESRVYIAGESDRGTSTKSDCATVGIDAATGNELWAQYYDGGLSKGIDRLNDLGVDPKTGDVVVTGQAASLNKTSDYVTIRYDQNGGQVWLRRYNNDANREEMAYALLVDPDGNSYVTGASSLKTKSVIVTLKYSPAGDSLWAAVYDSNASVGYALARDNSNNIYVGGSDARKGMLVCKYSAGGNLQWARAYEPGSGAAFARSIALDHSVNAVYVTGSSISQLGKVDMAVMRFNESTGDSIWCNTYNGLGSKNDNGLNAVAGQGQSFLAIGSSAGKKSGTDIIMMTSLSDTPPSYPKTSPDNELSHKGEKPLTFALENNYPNPFNPTTNIRFQIAATSLVRLTVYNVLGQQIARIVDGMRNAGEYTETWNAGNNASGLYFYRLEAGNFVKTGKMMLLK